MVLFSYFANVYLADIKIDPLVAFDKLVMSFIEVVLLAMTMDWYTSGNRQSVQFMIFSSKYQEINDAITSRLRRGCTLLEATGGYTGQPQKVLLVVVRKQQSVAISRIIEEIDPKAFVSNGAVRVSMAKASKASRRSSKPDLPIPYNISPTPSRHRAVGGGALCICLYQIR